MFWGNYTIVSVIYVRKVLELLQLIYNIDALKHK